ncbi:uncharacterized protein LOC121054160 [Oryza brachyantha]|uniref:uncharacterized protein LOC121054160 n=1 Tax=Oryza brachyantha TaxID=4533 RepID=UPI001ADD0B18|nr:uncharacterized protein LOC121054160 [Oryza brachyantha]
MATAGGCGGSVRMMVSYRGEIVQGDHGPGGGRAKAAPYYAGGVHRVVKVALSERLAGLRARMAALAGFSDVRIRYALPGEGLARLRDVADDCDLWGLVSLLLYYQEASDAGRVRAFLFGVDASSSLPRSASSSSLPTTSGGACGGREHAIAVQVKVSYAGEMIQREPGAEGQAAAAYYSGGIHRIVRVGLSERLADLRPRLAALAGLPDVSIRYALPEEEGLGCLRDVASDGDLWTLVSLLFFHEAVTDARPKHGRIRVFLSGADAPAAAPLGRSASTPFLPALVEEDEDDVAAVASPPDGSSLSTIPFVTQGMRRSVSSPELMTPPSGSNNMATLTPTAAAAPGDSAGSKDDMAGPVPAQLVAPVVWVPVTSAATVVIPVYYYPVDYPRVVLN